MTEPMIVDPSGAAQPRSGGFLWTTPEMYDPVKEKPAFTVQTVAEVFFGRSAPWLRKWQRQANQSTDLGRVESLRSRAGYHHYRLYDIERLAHVFAEHKVIDGDHLSHVVSVVRLVAQSYNYLPSSTPPSLDPDDEMPWGYVGFRQLMPAERAEMFHLLNRLLDNPSEEAVLSCTQFGDHKKSKDCNRLLDQTLYAVRELERHLRRREVTL
jgi:hypothetical protein